MAGERDSGGGMAGGEDSSGLGTVARTVKLLGVIAESEAEFTLPAISARVGLPRPTVHRLLNLLRESGMIEVETNPARYRIAREFYRIAALVSARHDIRFLARPIMEQVAARWRENCVLGFLMRHERLMIFAEEIPSQHSLRYAIPLNQPLPLEWGAAGRVMLAFMPESDVDLVIRNSAPSPVGGQRLPDRKEFLARLDQIRQRGWDMTEGEKVEGSRGIAAPVFDSQGSIVGSIGVAIPKERFPHEHESQVIASVVEGAASLTRLLGGRHAGHCQLSLEP